MVALVSQFFPLRKVGKLSKGFCPFHNDTDPSFTVYRHSAYCFGCNKYYSPVSFVKAIQKSSYWGAVEWVASRQGLLPVQLPREKEAYTTPIDFNIIEYWHNMVDREYHYSRMITDETINFYRLGWNGRRHVIPIWEGRPRESNVINVKMRGENPKYLNLKGRGLPKLFNKWVLNDYAIVFIGEYDAILGTQDGLPCISSTAGQDTWLPKWTELLNKMDKIFVVPDKGETVAGYNIASNFLGKAKLCQFPHEVKDYTEYRQLGMTPKYFCENILGVGYNAQKLVD
jgi:hypothetical protein